MGRTSQLGSLPTFATDKITLEEGGRSVVWREVTCPRGGCRKRFMVMGRWGKGEPTPGVRPCPYCFKVSKVP